MEKITKRDEDFASWYTDVVYAARLARYSNVKGCVIFEPNGCALWESMKSSLDKLFKETGHQNVMLPLFIPENLLNKESELVEGFAPEVAWVTHGGNKLLEERLCVRPTSESLFSDYYSSIVKSYRDLPIKYNQWANVVRWEKETRPFLRSREFFWQEGHTVHATEKEAEKETMDMLNVYKKFFEEYLAVPVLCGKKTEKEKFAGAEYTLTIEALMYNGICLQSGTSHYFGQKFSKAYDIKFLNKNNEYEYAYQTSWGVSNRMIGALIMVHSDDNGLVLPPNIAPTKIRIIPIGDDPKVIEFTNLLKYSFDEMKISYDVDNTDRTPGYKFAEAEVLGIPLRIEIGKRDANNDEVTIVRRDTNEKINVSIYEVLNKIDFLFKDIQENLLNKAKKRMEEKTYEASSLEELDNIMTNHPGFVKGYWCGETSCEEKIKEIKGTKSRCIIEENIKDDHVCFACGKKAKHKVMWGIQY